MGRHQDWRSWWSSLDQEDRRIVRAWLKDHPPPNAWLEDKVAYAFTEMAFAPRGRR